MSAARRYLVAGQMDQIEDVAQDVYLKLYELWQVQKLRHIEHLENYIYTLTKHDCLKRNQRHARLLPLEGDVESETPGLSPEEKETLYQAVNSLPETYIDVVRYVLKGYQLTEISDKLSIKLNTVKSNMKRAKALLEKK